MPSEAVVVRAPEQPGPFLEAEAKQGQTGRPKAGADKSAPIGPKVKATRSRRCGEGGCPLIQINGPGFPRADHAGTCFYFRNRDHGSDAKTWAGWCGSMMEQWR